MGKKQKKRCQFDYQAAVGVAHADHRLDFARENFELALRRLFPIGHRLILETDKGGVAYDGIIHDITFDDYREKALVWLNLRDGRRVEVRYGVLLAYLSNYSQYIRVIKEDYTNEQE